MAKIDSCTFTIIPDSVGQLKLLYSKANSKVDSLAINVHAWPLPYQTCLGGYSTRTKQQSGTFKTLLNVGLFVPLGYGYQGQHGVISYEISLKRKNDLVFRTVNQGPKPSQHLRLLLKEYEVIPKDIFSFTNIKIQMPGENELKYAPSLKIEIISN